MKFNIRKRSSGTWAVYDTDTERIISTHATRDGAAPSANQLNRAERTYEPPSIIEIDICDGR